VKNRSLLVAAIIALLALVSVGNAENTKNFVASLKGSNEVPPRDTNASGNAIFQVVNDGNELYFKLTVANIDNVLASHIHVAPEGVNGPVVAFLYGGPNTGEQTEGILAEGVITSADLVGPLAGMTIEDLIAAMAAGNTYVNVHTTQFPGGEIRGQIR
jgi:hypothetical protein